MDFKFTPDEDVFIESKIDPTSPYAAALKALGKMPNVCNVCYTTDVIGRHQGVVKKAAGLFWCRNCLECNLEKDRDLRCLPNY